MESCGYCTHSFYLVEYYESFLIIKIFHISVRTRKGESIMNGYDEYAKQMEYSKTENPQNAKIVKIVKIVINVKN